MSSSHALHYIERGITLIQHKTVRGFVLWPIIINAILLLCFSIYAYGQLSWFVDSWVHSLPSWLSFLSAIIKLLAVLFLIISTMFTFAIFTTVLAAPCYCLVAEKVALLLNHPVPSTALTFDAMWYLCWRSLGRECQKMVYYVPRVLLLVIISFIPVLNAISPVLWALWGAWMISIQFVDYAADNDLVGAKETRALLGKEKINTLLFGGLIMLGMLIPIVNIVMGTIAVAAATAYWVDLYQPTPQQNS